MLHSDLVPIWGTMTITKNIPGLVLIWKRRATELGVTMNLNFP